MGRPEISGFGHIDLTVTDGERSAQWWEQVLGFTLVSTTDRPGIKSWAMFHPTFVSVILLEHADRASDRFNERTVGLDHLALRVRDRAALDDWVAHLDQLEVTHSGVQDEVGGPLIVLRDPDNIQLELWAFDWELVGDLSVDSPKSPA